MCTTSPVSYDVILEIILLRLGKSVEEVSGSDREKAKRVVYAIVYGVGKT